MRYWFVVNFGVRIDTKQQRAFVGRQRQGINVDINASTRSPTILQNLDTSIL